MKNLQNILDFTKEELENIVQPKFRAKQIFEWIYKKYVDEFLQMSSLPKDFRLYLQERFHFLPLKCIKDEKSKD
ncbi:23S rRNA (adenine(2503)-C(2))-methyltransferase RlmN, partial [Campylobacter insulaenigrae]|nr:23S rRNA (adenine(2503)-C(2))-methyltransferase RlmN [Campylobacter insulaenigrae]